jgi:hypothetical protein
MGGCGKGTHMRIDDLCSPLAVTFSPTSPHLGALYFGKVSIHKDELWLKDEIDLFEENGSGGMFEKNRPALNAAVLRGDRFNLSFESHKIRHDLESFSFPDLKRSLANKSSTKTLK